MDSNNRQLENFLNQANQGDADALGKLVDHFRSHLQAMSEQALHGALKGRVGDSDVVQQSCLSAVQAFEHFEGDDLPQFAGWLRQIHRRNIQNVNRNHLDAQKRDISREQTNAAEIVDDSNQTPSALSSFEVRVGMLISVLRCRTRLTSSTLKNKFDATLVSMSSTLNEMNN